MDICGIMKGSRWTVSLGLYSLDLEYKPVSAHILNESSNRVALGALCLFDKAFDLET